MNTNKLPCATPCRALWRYYHGSPDPKGFENPSGLKQDFFAWYQDFGLEADLDLPLDRSSAAKRKLAALLESYYTSQDDRLPYAQFTNRMSFWMATGSGKTLVIVKLLEMLWVLIQRGEIPIHDALVLAHRDDLLEQLRQHVDEFNAGGGLYIRLHELREYAEVKHAAISLFRGQEMTVFYYRSDNLSDEQKEKIIDFRSYDNYGRWYILLDEAHKGDKEDSKRQHMYNILSRNGFLFNFSATFTDPRDIVTTAANYNLSEFIRKGHGKHISILKQETRAFKKGDEYTDEEKHKIVLKALIMLAYARQFERKVRRVRQDLYHRPLLMALVNSVNTEDADLKLFFRELVRIGKGEVDDVTWTAAIEELHASSASARNTSSKAICKCGWMISCWQPCARLMCWTPSSTPAARAKSKCWCAPPTARKWPSSSKPATTRLPWCGLATSPTGSNKNWPVMKSTSTSATKATSNG